MQSGVDLTGQVHGFRAVAMHADCVDPGVERFPGPGEDGPRLHHGDHVLRGLVAVMDHRAGQAAVDQCASGIIGAVGEDLSGPAATEITGNQELPKVMYIVPWQKSDPGDLMGRPVNTLLDEVLAPLDREEFIRQVDYYSDLKGSNEK